jgi:oligoribonuclease NrnB/cAMP/cGMP phosphodiesterase (DHH superfamily)
MLMKDLCIYHGNCADGFTAAWAVKEAVGWGAIDYFAAVHGNPPPDVTGRHVVIVDFSYKRPVLIEMAKKAKSIRIIDHHKTAMEDLKDLSFEPELEGCAVEVMFDMERSGAGITWDVFHPLEDRPVLVNYVEDRDLWRFNLPHSREFSAALFSHDYDFRTWSHIAKQVAEAEGFARFVAGGEAIERKHHKDIGELLGVTQRTMVIGGLEVPVANLPYTMTSDAGHKMAQGQPFAACYWDTPDGRVFSLRSADDGMDVGEVAKGYGGGGHMRAAGFRVPYGHELTR